VPLRCLLALGLSLLLAPAGAAEELYRWVDDQGQIHMTDDLSRVPASQRALVELEGTHRVDRSIWNEVDSSPAAAAAAPASDAGRAKRHVVPVARAGLELSVRATLNGRLAAGFKVDTGASLNTLPRSVARELGLDVGKSAPQTVVMGISGEPLLVPVVTVRDVDLGGARVEDVEFAVLDTLPYGLLGMPFFNHFRVQIDPAQGRLTLDEIDLQEIDGVYGGYDRSYWQARFAMIREQIRRIDAYHDRVPEEYTTVRERTQSAADYWRDQYEQLDLKATRAGVPQAWRE
jgi:predicted aspartyl protease